MAEDVLRFTFVAVAVNTFYKIFTRPKPPHGARSVGSNVRQDIKEIYHGTASDAQFALRTLPGPAPGPGF
jgi:hypothetical protein